MVSLLKTLRYLHLVTGVGVLLTGLFHSIPFFTQSAPINHIGLLAILTGLINLQQFNQPELPSQGASGAVTLASSTLLIIAACIPFCSLLVSPYFIGWNIWALAAGVLGVCLSSLITLVAELRSDSQPAATEAAPARKPRAKAERQGKANDGRETGTVKWFNTSKGFGFITRDSGSDVFVHFRSILGDGHRVLQEGQRVEYTVAKREKGLQAEEVAILD
jgi:CspA family cold shock protein